VVVGVGVVEGNHLVVVEVVEGSQMVVVEMGHCRMEVVGNLVVVEGVVVDILMAHLTLEEVVVEVWEIDDHHLELQQHRELSSQPEIGF
jgi:hypothetical protein